MNYLRSPRPWPFLLTYLFTLIFITEGFAQQRYDISYHFASDSVPLSGPQTFSNTITVTNHTEKQVVLTSSAENTESLNGMIRLPEKIVLNAEETKTFPLKYIADRQTITSNNQSFSISFHSVDPTIRIQPTRSFYINLQNDRTIILEPAQREYYINPSNGQAQLLLRVLNTGLTPQTVQPSFSGFPEGFQIIGGALPITLPAGGQSVLTYTANWNASRVNADFDLSIKALDPSGKTLTSSSVRIMSTGSIKRFGAINDLQNLPFRNSVAINYIDMGNYSSIYQFQAYGGFDVHREGTLDYRMTLDYYQQQKGFNMYDSYLDYQTKKWGVKLGNIYENLDQSVNGRGIKATYKFDSEQSLNIYAVNNRYMLFSQMFNFLDGGETFGATYVVGPQHNERTSITYLHRNDAFRDVNSDLANVKKRLFVGENQEILVEGGFSSERSEMSKTKLASSFGLNYNRNFGDYQLSSINYYSSPYYSGLRRGLTESDTRISKVLENNDRLSARVSYMDNKPAYQNGYTSFYLNNRNRIEIYEVGYLLGMGELQLELRPYHMAQRANYQNWFRQTLSPILARSRSARLASNFNYFYKSHQFSMLADYGYTSLRLSDRENSTFHSLRVTSNYNYHNFGFSTFIQLKPYYLSDLFSVARATDYNIFTLGPNTRFEVFNGKLRAQAAAMYSHYGFSGSNNFSFNADLQWHLKNNWLLTGQIYYTIIKGNSFHNIYDPHQTNFTPIPNYTFNNRQVRVGLEKKFGRKWQRRGHKLQIVLFEDANNNMHREDEEILTPGILVKIGDHGAITDRKGQAKFLGVTEGSYTIQIENDQGWVAQGPIELVITKNKKLELPLIKAKKVKGCIKAAANKYNKSIAQLGGIRINAIDTLGRKYQTFSDAAGNYTFYLPAGRYNLSISSEGLPFSIQNPSLNIDVEAHKNTQIPNFIYQDERRKIQIKRF